MHGPWPNPRQSEKGWQKSCLVPTKVRPFFGLWDDHQQQQPPAPVPGCNCINGTDTCPAWGKCLTDCVVYKATVTETVSGKAETYTGMTGNAFKDRWYGHSADMRKPANRIKTKLGAHVWDLNDDQTDFEVKWDFIDRATTFNPITRKCRLCLKEKFHIMYNTDASTLNKSQEIFNTCRHRTQKLLINVKTWSIISFFLVQKISLN